MNAERTDAQDSHGSDAAQDTGDAWKDVEERFAALSESLVSAAKAAWNDEENQRAIREMESGLRTLASDVASAVDEAAKSPEGQKLRAEAEKTARAVHDASEQMVDDARPHVAKALGSISEGLRSAADELNRYSSQRSAQEEESDSQ
jgi:hypothetical protein